MVLIRPAMIASALLSVGAYRLMRRVSRSTVHCSALRSNPAGWRSTLQSRWMFWRIKLRRNVAMAPARARATMTTTRTCARTASARASRQNRDLVRKISDPIPSPFIPLPPGEGNEVGRSATSPEWPAGLGSPSLRQVIPRPRAADSRLLARPEVSVIDLAVVADQPKHALDGAALQLHEILRVGVLGRRLGQLRGISDHRLGDAQLLGQNHPPHCVGHHVRPLGVVLLEHWRQWLVAELAADDLEVRRVGGRGPERGELAGVGGENIAPARSQSIKRLLGFGKRDLLKPEVAQAHLICDVSFARCSGEDANTRAVEII